MNPLWSSEFGDFEFDPEDGALVRVSPPGEPDRSALLGEAERTWHHPPRRWGKGFVITDRGAARWHTPDKALPLQIDEVRFSLQRVGLQLRVERSMGAAGLEERYVLSNSSDEPVRIGSLGISVPFRDIYPSAAECLEGAFHAHLWTGGSNSWAWAAPMNGTEHGLGLDLLEGALWCYSVENRDHFISSNIRGHLYVHLTDYARNPEAFGGQPELVMPPGDSLSWRWRLAWYSGFEAFQKSRASRDFSLVRLMAKVGENLPLTAEPGVQYHACGTGLRISGNGMKNPSLECYRPGIHWIEARAGERRSRAAVLFHRSVAEIVQKRVEFILRHQQALPGEPTREGAFLVYDRDTGLTEIGGAWGDWSDGRERFAMPLLIQGSLARGIAVSGGEEALEQFRDYASRFLVMPGNTILGGSHESSTKRLYNYPWASEFFRNEYRRTGRMEDLRRSADILAAYYTHGGGKFLGFLYGVAELIELLQACGEVDRANDLRENVILQARHFREAGVNLPRHEVNYEQSMVAPLALLLLTAQRLLPGEDWSPSIRQVLAWLAAFSGKQPDARLTDIPIRHWDGFWFGKNRQWGDVFPHYWSVLSAAAYLEAVPFYPDLAKSLEERANRIFRANLVHFQEDGFASCAFVYPSCVNNQPAHQFDPLANDQDWALVWLLRYADRLPWAGEFDESVQSPEPGKP